MTRSKHFLHTQKMGEACQTRQASPPPFFLKTVSDFTFGVIIGVSVYFGAEVWSNTEREMEIKSVGVRCWPLNFDVFPVAGVSFCVKCRLLNRALQPVLNFTCKFPLTNTKPLGIKKKFISHSVLVLVLANVWFVLWIIRAVEGPVAEKLYFILQNN